MNKSFFFRKLRADTREFLISRAAEREKERVFSCHREEKIDFPRDKLEFWSFERKLGRAVSLLVLDERSTDDGSYFSCYIFMTWNGEICERGKFPLEYSAPGRWWNFSHTKFFQANFCPPFLPFS